MISVSLKHLVNFHFCRTDINLPGLKVYAKHPAIPVGSRMLFFPPFLLHWRPALLEVIKNAMDCSQICFLYDRLDPVRVHMCVHLWRNPQGCALQSVLSAEEYWGIDMSSGASTLKSRSKSLGSWQSLREVKTLWEINPKLSSLSSCKGLSPGVHPLGFTLLGGQVEQ